MRGSIDEQRSIVPYNFRVLYMQPEDAFVLENWGTFLLKKIQLPLLILTTAVIMMRLYKTAYFLLIGFG